MNLSKVVEYVFFFSLLLLTGLLVWKIMAPFVSALALSIIIVTICYPLYQRILKRTPRKSESLAALLSTLFVLVVIVIPIFLISSLVVGEVVNFYTEVGSNESGINDSFARFEGLIQTFIPDFELNMAEQIATTAQWLTGNIGAIFAGTISTIFIFIIALVGSFYFFRDGKEMLDMLIKASPLPDNEDEIIFKRMAIAVRSVATGTVLTALIQGALVSIGFTFFGVERAILWGSIASVGALIPGIGTTIITVPAVLYLFFQGDTANAFGLLLWSMLIVGMVDNVIAPYLISRGNNLHPFIILLSVLGGISLFGPIGFVIGPVTITLFLVLLEIYSQYIIKEKPVENSMPFVE